MSTPAAHDFGAMVQGNTWNGIPSMTVTINGQQPDTALNAVKMQFRKSATDQAKVTLLSGTDITINDAAAWNITIPPQVLELCAGDWMTDIEFTNAAGVKKTYVAGRLKVLPAITRMPYENG